MESKEKKRRDKMRVKERRGIREEVESKGEERR